MAYDFSKLVKIGNKILYSSKNNGLVVLMKNDEPVIDLPANTLRFRFSNSSIDPTSIENGGTWKKVSNSEFNDYDWTCDDTSWENKFGVRLNPFDLDDSNIQIIASGDTSNVTNMSGLFSYCASLTSVHLFDTSNVTDMSGMFAYCTSLTSVPLFNTSNVINMANMFDDCSSLTTVPLFDISSITNMHSMCRDCTKVESGAFALYQRASAIGKVKMYTDAFYNCGKDTETGLAELQQIPQSWGGLAVG